MAAAGSVTIPPSSPRADAERWPSSPQRIRTASATEGRRSAASGTCSRPTRKVSCGQDDLAAFRGDPDRSDVLGTICHSDGKHFSSQPLAQLRPTAAHLDPCDATGTGEMLGRRSTWMDIGWTLPREEEGKEATGQGALHARRSPPKDRSIGPDPRPTGDRQPQPAGHVVEPLGGHAPSHQAIAPGRSLSDAPAEGAAFSFHRVDHRDQFEVIGSQGDDPVAGAPPGMPATGLGCQPVSFRQGRPCRFQVRHRVDDMIDPEHPGIMLCARSPAAARTRARGNRKEPMDDPNEEARKLAADFWEDILQLEPMIGTMVGDERFDDKLSDPGPEGRARSEEVHRRALDAIQRFDRKELDEEGRTILAVIEAIARRQLARLGHRIDRFDAVTHLFGPSQLLADFGSMQRADTPERLERYRTRLGLLPAFLDEVGEVARDAATVGQTVPVLVVDRSIAQVQRLLATSPEDSPGMAPVPERDADGRRQVVEALRDQVWPAYGRYLEALRQYRSHARETIGLYVLKGGDAIYAAEILAFTSLPLEPEAVHRLGLEDLSKIQTERMEIARSLGFPDPKSAVAEYTASGRNTAKSRQELVAFAEGQVRRGWDAAPRYFGRLPRTNCEVRPVEEFREDDVPGAFYQPPNADNTRPGVYYINCSALDQRLLHQIASTTYHEANPGHHFQISIEQEYSDRPAVRRFGGLLAGSAFAEGWGLYSERLA